MHTAEDAKDHLVSAKGRLDNLMNDPRVAELRTARDAIPVQDGDLFAEYERQKANDRILQKIQSDPDLKSAFDTAMSDIEMAASKHQEFLNSARKRNVRPDQLLDMDKVDSKLIEQLKEKMKQVGLRGDDKRFDTLEKMSEKIREVVAALVERFKNTFGMKQ